LSTMFKIFVGNVSFATTEEQLRAIFEPHITIEDLVIPRDDTGRSQGYAFVMTRDADKGRQAMRRIGKVMVDGRRIYTKEAHGKKKPPPRPRGRDRRPSRRSGPHRSRSSPQIHINPDAASRPRSSYKSTSGYSNNAGPGDSGGSGENRDRRE